MTDQEVQRTPTATLAYSLVGDRLHLVEREIERACNSEIALVRRHSEYVVQAGGKRLRPAMVLLCTKICGYMGDDDVKLGAVIEFIHTATLVHDDIVDGAEVRRGQEAANQVWGNQLAVLLGDYIYMRSLAMSVELGSLRLVEILTEATSRLLEGEILDVSSNGNVELTDKDYLETIDRKTASLFAAAGQASAILADATPEYEQALASYGGNIGMAFQIIDDLLDYSADPARFGKKVGADLREGKMTLPAIYLLRDGEKAAQEHFLGCFGDPELSDDDLNAVVMAVRACGALDASYMAAAEYAHLAEASLEELEDSLPKQALVELPGFVLSRQM